jgi:membrane protein implicated in regulation of membrane protease activity
MLVLGYVVLAVLGAGYVLVSMLLGHLVDFGSHDVGAHSGGDAHSASADYGVDHSGHGDATAGDGVAAAFHFPFFSPLALATLAAAIGGLGLVARFGFRLEDGPSLLVAVPGALVVTYLVTWAAWRVASGSRGTSTISAEALVGVPAEILTPIPAGGVGEAAAFVSGQRFAGPAREVDGREVPRGASVTVVRLSGATLIVKMAAASARQEVQS